MNAHTEFTATASVLTVPVWADDYLTELTTCDITDIWLEETGDDESEATAYFEANADTCGDLHYTMTGISVDDGHGLVFYNAERATHFLTLDAVIRIERVHTEAQL